MLNIFFAFSFVFGPANMTILCLTENMSRIQEYLVVTILIANAVDWDYATMYITVLMEILLHHCASGGRIFLKKTS